jgi:hypothetical protein
MITASLRRPHAGLRTLGRTSPGCFSSYECESAIHPITGKPAIALKRQPHGDCFYLGPTGCTIHERAPPLS